MALSQEARAEIEDARVPLCAPALGDVMEEPAIEASPRRVGGEDIDDLLRGQAVGLEVVVAAEHEIVDAPRVGIVVSIFIAEAPFVGEEA